MGDQIYVLEETSKQQKIITRYVRELSNKFAYYYRKAREKKFISKIMYDEIQNTKEKHFKKHDFVFIKEIKFKDKISNKSNGTFQIIKILEYLN